MQPSHLSEFIKGKRAVSAELAERLEKATGIPRLTWLKLQQEFDFAKLKDDVKGNQEHEAERALLEYNAVYDLKTIFKHVGITKKSNEEKLAFCKNELHFATPAVEQASMKGYFHRSEKTGLDQRMIGTWTVLAKYEAAHLAPPTGTWDRAKSDELAKRLSEIFHTNSNTINLVMRTCSEYGVKFCIVPKLPHASIDGFAFYDGPVPCIVVTKRFNRIDNFAFAVLHEVAHLKLHLNVGKAGKVTLVNPDLEQLSRDEEEANAYAADQLIDAETWSRQPAVQLIPRHIEKAFTRWARAEQINKWIVLGRVAHETNMYMFKSDESREIR